MAIDMSQPRSPRFSPWALGGALKASRYLPLHLVVGLERPAFLYVDLEKVSGPGVVRAGHSYETLTGMKKLGEMLACVAVLTVACGTSDNSGTSATVAPTTTVWVVHTTTLQTFGDVGGSSSPTIGVNGEPLISTTDITIGVDGNPLISHMDIPNSDLELYVCDDPACSSGTNVTLETTGEVGWAHSIAIGVDGNPIISHTDATRDPWELDGCEDPACGGDLVLYVCDDPACSSGTNVTLETTGSVGWDTSIAIGVDGNPIISHYDDTNEDLELYVCDDPACSSGTNVTLETTGDVGWDTSIAIGVDGSPVISHYDATNGDLELYVCDDPACSSGTNVTLETDGNVGFRASLVIGVTGNPVIAHMDRANEDLELYVCDDPACSSGTNVELETTGSLGWDPAITISDNGYPVISHTRWNWDEADGDLELYVCDNLACSSGTNVTLVTTGSVGVFSSITIGDDGNPVIAHQEYAKGDLEFTQVMMPASAVADQ
jgi:fructose-specific phosphotransferase system component IIB